MWRNGEAVSNAIFRLAMTDADGIAAPTRMARKLGWPETSPKLPAHVTAWIEAEKARPWPPER